ncbi:MAG: tRNA (adenosine(37)-N6)-threonylcarbamoyltransferase complex transferase subunit TsaD [Acetobacter sp.]|nr:tRNA (adenosine(37)-N6)-threonylcarbamoyltransferase complex transferase subunit TsaD [Bacteroides sp.]MCM1341201.1 tRNA (adenosine(37)-N6)-threonylcarbamoyltransferase complex transferase subunit TsaD [Acetobacter sp.]MCM1433844.1 tRNA (adenosine(37)-N6)-threonylcarbamoyltransferase complex transferase subunit TsaD [Clostridiales bacterium]
MKILGIESSCDETAAAVVEDGRKVLSNVIATSLEEHKLYGGVVPEIASRRHAESISSVVEEALKNADCKMSDIDAIAVTYAPGLIGALLVGVNFAKGLALATDTPLVPVHHIRGHIASNYISSDAKPPFLCLVVSGGHSHIVAVNSYTDFEIIGKTRDDAAGEALDKAGRTMGLEYPGGVSIDRISAQGDENAFKFPKPRVSGSPYDFSFSGLKTCVINTVHNSQQKGIDINTADLAASFQKGVVDCLITNLEKAAVDKGFDKIVIAGGVSANSKLRKEAECLCKKHGWQFYLPLMKYCGDNAAMIASQGYYEFKQGVQAAENLNAYATMPIDKSYKTD